jgi:hypothetical protein
MQCCNAVLLLLCASGLSFLAYGLDTAVELNLWLAIVLLVVSFISCTFSFIQEGKASDVMSVGAHTTNSTQLNSTQLNSLPSTRSLIPPLHSTPLTHALNHM